MIVIIPAYEPDFHLVDLIKELTIETDYKILVVDDGSSSDKNVYFNQIKKHVILLKHNTNMGKGAAMKTALRYIIDHNYKDCVIFLDADGQHKIKDVIRLKKKYDEDNNKVLIGSRNFNLKQVPLRSKIGNKLTSRIIKRYTKKYINDTQTGLRLIPNIYLKDIINLYGERYEYEMNMLLYFLKNNIPIEEIPIETIYETKKNESSHYNPIKDSLRVYKAIYNSKKI